MNLHPIIIILKNQPKVKNDTIVISIRKSYVSDTTCNPKHRLSLTSYMKEVLKVALQLSQRLCENYLYFH